mgnify:CR=1 FL=1
MTSTPAHFRFWPPHLSRELRAPETNLVENLRVNAMRYPNKAAVVFFDAVLTYGELARQVDSMAAYLQSLGLAKGERVLLLMQTAPSGWWRILLFCEPMLWWCPLIP